MEHFLFDLDGTLLPMDQEVFVKFYMPMLAARFKDRGVPQEKLIGAVWNGVGSMVMNDGSRTNEDAFWDCFSRELSIERADVEDEVLDFMEMSLTELYSQPVRIRRRIGLLSI